MGRGVVGEAGTHGAVCPGGPLPPGFQALPIVGIPGPSSPTTKIHRFEHLEAPRVGGLCALALRGFEG